MIRGSSIYSTGGGIEYGVQRRLFRNLFRSAIQLSLVSLDELSDYNYVCTAYAVGSAKNTNFDLSKQLRLGINALENILVNIL